MFLYRSHLLLSPICLARGEGEVSGKQIMWICGGTRLFYTHQLTLKS